MSPQQTDLEIRNKKINAREASVWLHCGDGSLSKEQTAKIAAEESKL